MCTGKTLAAMTAALVADHYITQGSSQEIMPTLVVCPRVVVCQWRNEILKFTNLQPHQVIAYTSDLSGDQRKQLVNKSNLSGKQVRFVIVNYDLMRSETSKVKLPKGKKDFALTPELADLCGPLFKIEW